MFRAVALALAMALAAPALAEVPKLVRPIGLDAGLSQSTVTDILQVPDGRIWFATGDGLNLYDGQGFTQIFRHAGDETGLQSNYLTSLFLSPQGQVWVGSFGGGFALFDLDGRALANGLGPGVGQQGLDVHGFAADPAGRVWVAASAGLRAYAPGVEGARVAEATPPLPPVLAEGAFRTVAVLPGGPQPTLLAGAERQGLWLWPMGAAEALPARDPAGAPLATTVLDIHVDPGGQVWIATEDRGTFRLNPDTARLTPVAGLDRGTFTALATGDDGRLWAASDGEGVFALDPLARSTAGAGVGAVENYRAREGQSRRLPSNWVLALAADRVGRIWVGTGDGGAASLSMLPNVFETWLPDPEGMAGPVSGTIWAIAETPDGALWIGTRKGLSRFDPVQRLFRPVPLGEGSPDVRAILPWQGRLLLAVRHRGLLLLDPATGAVGPALPPDQAGLFDDVFLRLLLADADGTLWVGTHSGLYHLSPELGLLRHFTAGGGALDLPHDRVRALYQAPGGQVWVGTSGGLSRLERGPGGRPAGFTTFAGPDVLPDDDVRAVFQRDAATVYAGTQGGVSVLDLTTGKARFIGRDQGLPNETLYALLPDAHGALWATTNNGLARLDLASDAVRVYRARDGLQGAEFNFNAHAALSDGRLAVGGIDGFSLFDPARLRVNDTPPVLALRVVAQDAAGQAMVRLTPGTAGGAEPPPLRLPEAVQSLVVDAGVHHFDDPARNRLRWRLAPVDATWTEAEGVRHHLLRENLRPGTYRMELEALSAAGVAAPLAVVSFVVPVPAWRAPLALAGYAFLALAALWGLLRARTWQLDRANRALQQAVTERTAALKRSHAEVQALALERARFYSRTAHEIRTPLSLIRAPLRVLAEARGLSARERQMLAVMDRASDRLTQLSVEMTEVGREAAGLRRGQVSVGLAGVIGPVVDLYRAAATTRGITLNSDVPPDRAVTLDPVALETVLHNLLSNALRACPEGGAVTFSVRVAPDALRIDCANDGPPLPPEATERLRRHAEGDPPEPAARGLEIVGAVLRAAGGRAEVAADRARVTVWLPAHVGAEAPATQAADPAVPRPQGAGPGRVLIVEDDRDLRFYLSDLLGDLAEVQAVGSLGAARRAVDRWRVDLILCDAILPDGSGFDFCRSVKEAEATGHIPVIFLTALDAAEAARAGLVVWADDVMTKPFDAAELVARVRLRLRASARLQNRAAAPVPAVVPRPTEAPATTPCAPADERLMARLEAFLAARLDEGGAGLADLTLDAAAEACALSRRAFQRRVVTLYGQPFSALLTQRRMRRAADLLAQGMAVTEVATACGYASLSSFSRQFKDVHGQSPRDFRREGGAHLAK